MNIKQTIVRTMMNRLPPKERVVMVREALKWLYSDYTPDERQKKLTFWIPRLIWDISAGEYGLGLLVFHYLKYFVSLRWLRYWYIPMQVPQEDLITCKPGLISSQAAIQEVAK